MGRYRGSAAATYQFRFRRNRGGPYTRRRMPKFPALPGVVGFWRALAEIDPQAIAIQAVQPVSIAIVGPPDAGKETLRRALVGFDEPGAPAQDAPRDPGHVTVAEVEPGGRLEWLP